MLDSFRDWVIKSHKKSNHFYDVNLPYDFHLRTAVRIGEKWMYLVVPSNPIHLLNKHVLNIKMSLWGHDVIEDARCSYSDVLKRSNLIVAETIRAVTNYSRGRTRLERMPDFIYDDIRATYDADFVKICDRIANVSYGKFVGSSMVAKYADENDHFISKVTNREVLLAPMIQELENLFK